MITGKISYLPKSTTQKKRKEKKNVRATVIDTHMYKESIDDIKEVRDKLYKNSQKHDFVEQLTEDLFHCLYKSYPDVYNIEDIVEENKVSYEIMSNIINSENFEKLRNNTVSNLFNSTLSLSAIQDQAIKVLNDYMKNKDMKDLMDNISQAKSARKKLENQQKAGEDSQKTEKELNDILDKIKQKKENLQFDLDDLNNDLVNGLESANQMVGDVNDMLNGFGGNEDPSVRKLSYNQKVELAQSLQNSNKFKEIADMVGRMSHMANKVGKKPSAFGHSISDIGLGQNIPKVLNSEKLKLTDKDLEMDFMKKYVSKGLLEFKTDGSEDGKGPMVICIDESGSMFGQRETWSKAFCIACIQIAHKQKRNCKIITFSSKLGRTFEFDRKKIDPKGIVDFAEYFLDGGTDFDKPLMEAIHTTSESKYKKADILFVTDGDPQDPVDNDCIDLIRSEREKRGLRVQSVLIGDGINERYVNKFSDDIIRISNLNQDGAIINVFNNIQR